jgi:hypothetical protein
MVSKKVISEMRKECECEKLGYCPAEELLLHLQSSDRLFLQHKAVEKYKMIESKRLKKDIGWKIAYQSWVDSGNAKLFGDIYVEGISLAELYKMLFKTEIKK